MFDNQWHLKAVIISFILNKCRFDLRVMLFREMRSLGLLRVKGSFTRFPKYAILHLSEEKAVNKFIIKGIFKMGREGTTMFKD